ncbi:hypothetical protein V8D89_016321 [Ganoderma adspersum]
MYTYLLSPAPLPAPVPAPLLPPAYSAPTYPIYTYPCPPASAPAPAPCARVPLRCPPYIVTNNYPVITAIDTQYGRRVMLTLNGWLPMYQPSVKPSLTLCPFGIAGTAAGLFLTDTVIISTDANPSPGLSQTDQSSSRSPHVPPNLTSRSQYEYWQRPSVLPHSSKEWQFFMLCLMQPMCLGSLNLMVQCIRASKTLMVTLLPPSHSLFPTRARLTGHLSTAVPVHLRPHLRPQAPAHLHLPAHRLLIFPRPLQPGNNHS